MASGSVLIVMGGVMMRGGQLEGELEWVGGGGGWDNVVS